MSKRLKFGGSVVPDKRLPKWRSQFVLLGMLAGFSVLIGRAAWLQIVSDDFLQEQGAKRMERTLPLKANRGSLFDRNRSVLAQSVPAQAIWFDSRRTEKATDEQLTELARLLGHEPKGLIKKIRADKRHFAYLDRQVESETAERIRALKVPGLGFLAESKRYYPQGESSAHLVGFTDIEDRGQEGVELAFNERLTGIDGERSVLRDRLGNVIEDIRELRPPTHGEDLTLSVDSDLQFMVLNELRKAVDEHKAKAGAAVVLNARTGELLAMANIPTYDPNDRRALYGSKLRNRVFTDMFEPGSTLKPFTVALALDQGKVRPNSRIDIDNGRLKIGPAVISDVKTKGILTVEEIIQKSSNVGTSKIALDMPAKDMWTMFHEVGFGQAPSIHFPGTASGLVRPWNKWRPIEQATMSYGHGISVSLIQLAQAYTVFANEGRMVEATLVKVEDPSQVQYKPVFSAKAASQMLHMLEKAAGPEGTAPKAQVQGYSVAGKTGTAHKLVGGKYINKYVASFVGLAPASNPKIVVAVMVDEPSNRVHYGGLVAGPVFSRITQQTLTRMNVQPDLLTTPRNLVSAPAGVAL